MSVDLPITRKAVAESKGDAEVHYDTDPDIICDLRKIPLPDNVAEAAMAIHVIEHFYAWQAPEVLAEWFRVLKPGGVLAIECPCFDKIVALASVPNCPPHLVHWGLYGDPRYKDPAMCHRWCYTEAHLMKLMAEAGFVGLRGKPPVFHQQVRDMRIVGHKPEEAPRVIVE